MVKPQSPPPLECSHFNAVHPGSCVYMSGREPSWLLGQQSFLSKLARPIEEHRLWGEWWTNHLLLGKQGHSANPHCLAVGHRPLHVCSLRNPSSHLLKLIPLSRFLQFQNQQPPTFLQKASPGFHTKLIAYRGRGDLVHLHKPVNLNSPAFSPQVLGFINYQ